MELYPKSITKRRQQKILEKMNEINNSICKINSTNEIGLFCNIKFNHKIIPVLIINNYMNNDNYLNKIQVILNNKEEIIEIQEIIYKDITQNITIIKIKDNNNKNIKYIEIDDKLYEKESEIYYNNESIYIMQIKKEDILVSYGIIKEINKYELIYKGNIKTNYCLIFNLNNNKLIGIHKYKSNYFNKGFCFNNIIKRIKNNINYINEINILVDIKNEDINKKIYFINDDNNDLRKLNENNIDLYINDKKEKYITYIIAKNIGINKIILKFKKELHNANNMFKDCTNIIEINFFNFTTNQITNMKYMFCKCKNLKKINNLSFDTKNVESMIGIFDGCKSLNNLPDISKWDTKNVEDMKDMFNQCILLEKLPDISGWNTQNVKSMSNMFRECKSLYSFPDISKWDTKNVKDMSYMFYHCSSLIDLPDYSKWDTKNVKNTRNIFSGCSSLKNIPKNFNIDNSNNINKY